MSSPAYARILPGGHRANSSENTPLRQSLSPDNAVKRSHIGLNYTYPVTEPSRRKENRQQEVSEISRELKILAKDLNIPVIALSQLSREVEHKHPPVPVLSDLRDSGALEQDADIVMFIYRGDMFEPNTDKGAQLLVLKQRNGPTGEVRLVFNNLFARFDERAEPHQECLALQRVR